MSFRDRQCPVCRAWFHTSNTTKRYCGEKCQQRNKAMQRRVVTQADFRPGFQDQHRRNSGADASRRAAMGPPQVDWAPVVERWRGWLNERYADEGDDQ